MALKPIPNLNDVQQARLWSNIDVRGNDVCWLWKAGTFSNGRASVSINDETYVAARVVYYLHNGIDPLAMCVCHNCDNVLCCNPYHLFLGTEQDNIADRVNKGRCARIKGQDCVHAKLNEEQVKRIRFLRGLGLQIKEIAVKFNVKPRTIRAVVERENWKHI